MKGAGPVEYTGADVVTDAFFEQDTVLVLKHGLVDTKKVLEGIYVFCRVFHRSVQQISRAKVPRAPRPPLPRRKREEVA